MENIVPLGLSPCPVRVTTKIIILLVGDPYKIYKPFFATVTGGGTTQSTTIIVVGVFPPKIWAVYY